ncbi:MAG TPA: nucleotidyltransferase domain-containing protein [Longimicrobiaceae bacterium]
MIESSSRARLAEALSPLQLHAARCVVARVRVEIAPELVQASLFGSRARGDARPDSDVDLLLVFRSLPPDREPYASEAESIAEQEARRLHVPVTVWSVSLEDLAVGQRTPMLVDALADSIPLWCREAPLPAVPFTPVDAIHCVETLLRRIDEGSQLVRIALRQGRSKAAARRVRDDLVRACTAHLLLSGITRPRRAEAVRQVLLPSGGECLTGSVAEWVERSFGFNGTDEHVFVPPPPGGFAAAAELVEELRRAALQRLDELRARLGRW